MGFFGGASAMRVVGLLAFAAWLAGSHAAVGQTLMDVGAASSIQADMQAKNAKNKVNKVENDQPDDEGGFPDDADFAGGLGDDDPQLATPKSWDKWDDDHSIKRSRSYAVSWWKTLLVVIAMLTWVRTGDWINRDCQIFRINFLVWNSVVLICGLIGGAVLFVLPFFASGPLLYVICIGLIVSYGMSHNAAVEPHQKVFTKDWLQFQMASLTGKKTEKQAAYMQGAAVDFQAMGSDDPITNKANLQTARRSPGYLLAKQLVSDMVTSRSEQSMLDYRQDTVAVRRLIDGVWHNGESMERDSGDVMLAVLKQLANLKPADRQSKQEGEIGAQYDGGKYAISLKSQGVKTGERVVVGLKDVEAKALRTYKELGMRDKIREQWEAVMAADAGFVVISAMPGGGLTTLFDVSLMETDRLMRDFFSIEDVNNPDREIENVVVKPYDSKKGESPVTNLEKLVRLYPNVYVCRDFVNGESAKALLAEVRDEKLLVTSTHAKEAPEALLRLIQKKAPHRDVAELTTAVINMRLIRLLCDECKVGYEPAPALLQKLGIPAGKVQMLYRPPEGEEIKKPCAACGGIGYRGRTGLFELLVPNEKCCQTLLKQPKMEHLRKAARTAGMRNHQEEGILLVAKGATSLQELQRVLKE